MDITRLKEELCRQLCAEIGIVQRNNGMLMISTPFSYPDGDQYSIYLKEISAGKFRISDQANTMMRLSYNTPDVSKYYKGSYGEIMAQILRENEVQEDDGNFYIDLPIGKIAEGIFRLGQTLNQIYDLSYLNRNRFQSGHSVRLEVEDQSVFYHSLEELLNTISSKNSYVLKKEDKVLRLENSYNYPIDYSLTKDEDPFLFLFGVPNAEKAKSVTTTLQHLSLKNIENPSLLVFQNQKKLPHAYSSKLVDANVGGSQVSSINSVDAIEKNIESYARQATH